MDKPNLLSVAGKYLAYGLCILPADRDEKRPALPGKWEAFKARLPSSAEIGAWFANPHEALCLVCGSVSGNLEMIDFDLKGELLAAWKGKVEAVQPGLAGKLVVESTQSAGYHVAYRCQAEVCGNLKLAQRKHPVAEDEIHLNNAGREVALVEGKEYVVRVDEIGLKFVVITLIETRGEGGLFLCAPTPGYSLVQGDFARLPVLTEAERDVLLQAAWELNEYVPTPANSPASDSAPTTSRIRPGDDFNDRGDIRNLLGQHGWTLVKGGENEYWRRPGKTRGWSATFKDRVFYVFSSNAVPFEPNQAYAPFSVYAHLEHHGDFARAASQLRAEGFGGVDEAGVDLSGFCATAAEPAARPFVENPGPLPETLLRVPGFISEVMDHCLATAPYPNLTMAFCGALALQAFLAGRKVRDPGDNRTNLYLLGLAHSAAGKDWPRKVNTRILHQVGMADCLGERFASGEGIQDALFIKPAMLFQTDEIDGMLQQINKSADARHENMMTTLLTMYSASNSVFPMRRKAGKASAGAIDQPCLTVFGTAIPNHYYSALSERMLTNGLFARNIILESGPRPVGQEPRVAELPARIVAIAKWWADFNPGRGNLEHWHPVPLIVEHSDEARKLLMETREQADLEYARAEEKSDTVGTTVWGRVSEQTRKLALIYAASENHQSPRISLAAAQWASTFVMHQTRRMLYMAQQHVAENPFHAECLKLVRKLTEAGGQMQRQHLLRAMRCKAQDFDQLISTLVQQGQLEPVDIRTKTKPAQGYKVL